MFPIPLRTKFKVLPPAFPPPLWASGHPCSGPCWLPRATLQSRFPASPVAATQASLSLACTMLLPAWSLRASTIPSAWNIRQEPHSLTPSGLHSPARSHLLSPQIVLFSSKCSSQPTLYVSVISLPSAPEGRPLVDCYAHKVYICPPKETTTYTPINGLPTTMG